VSSTDVVTGVKKIVILTFAGLFFVLGFLGALLPGLPATPFLLLTSFLLLRTSPRLNARLRRSRLFGPILTDWEDHGGVRRNVKIKAVLFVLVSVGLTLYFGPQTQGLRYAIVLLALIGITVVLRLPTPSIHESSADSDTV
jgi:hypothetical protein